MCYKLHQITQCPSDGIVTLAAFRGEEDDTQHHAWSVIRCSSPKPCRGDGFGTLTKFYQERDYCQSCLGSVVAARSPEAVDVLSEFRINEFSGELVDNIINYVDHLLEFALLALHESLPQPVVNSNTLYPVERLMTTSLWETMCVRCKLQVRCRCRPGCNENSWNVSRYVRTHYAKTAFQRVHAHTEGNATAPHVVRVRNEVQQGINNAVSDMGGDPIYDVGPVDENDAETRFNWIAHEMLDAYRGSRDALADGCDAEAVLASLELTIKFDLVELMASVVAHDAGVPAELVRAVGSRLLPIVMLTRQHLAPGFKRANLPSLRTPHDTLAYAGWGNPDQTLNMTQVELPLSAIMQNGVFLPALFEMVRQEALFLRGLYDADPASVEPRYIVDGGDDDARPRFRGGFEIAVRQFHRGLVNENAEMNAYEASRVSWWRMLLREVDIGVQWIPKWEMPVGGPSSQCFIHLSDFWEDAEIEECRLDVHGGELEPQPTHVHRPIRFHNCVRSENPHAFCMASLAQWVFQREQDRGGSVRITGMRPRECNMCRRDITRMPGER